MPPTPNATPYAVSMLCKPACHRISLGRIPHCDPTRVGSLPQFDTEAFVVCPVMGMGNVL